MGFFDNFTEPHTLKAESNWTTIFSNFETSSGAKITSDNAMRHSIVWACNKVLSESIASLPLVLYKEDDNGNRTKAKEHPLYNLLSTLPNKEHTSMQWRETMITSLNYKGNHYTQIIRNQKGEIVSLYGLDTNRMTVQRLESTGEIVFLYDTGTKTVPLNFGDVLNVAGLSIDGLVGLSPIAHNAESIGLSVAMEEFGGKYFKNGSTATGALSYPNELTEEAYKRLKEDFNKNWAGMKNTHKPLLLEGGAKFEKLSMSNQDSQFLEARKYQKQDIAMIFRVPLHMLNDLEKANYNSLEQLSLGFVIYSLTPILVRLEQAFMRDLLTDNERKQGYYIKHNLAGLLRGDMKTRFNVYDKAIKNGIYTINDVLRLEDMNQVENGNDRYMQGAMTTIENINKGTNYGAN